MPLKSAKLYSFYYTENINMYLPHAKNKPGLENLRNPMRNVDTESETWKVWPSCVWPACGKKYNSDNMHNTRGS